MRYSFVAAPVAALYSLLMLTGVAGAQGWTEIDASDAFTDRLGNLRQPSCSGAPVADPAGGPIPVPADTEFSFFVRYGDPRKLAIVFDGGGTCYNDNTCILASLSGNGTFSPEVDETVESLATIGGLGDSSNPANPVRNYTQVFIPYCTADLHTGANDQIYGLPLPGGDPSSWTIHHRGADNVAAVLKWLDEQYWPAVGRRPTDVFLTGLSAGGYGVLYHTPAIASRLPWYTRMRILADAASGVITDNFIATALDPGGAWASWTYLPDVLAGAFSADADELIVETYKSLGRRYPSARFGQYTTAFDATQIFFYNVDRNADAPELWLDPTELAISAFDWTLRARTYQILTALQTFNYRYYLAEGDEHTILADDAFYTETSGSGIPLAHWLDDMLNRFWPFGSDWRNASCTPNCLP